MSWNTLTFSRLWRQASSGNESQFEPAVRGLVEQIADVFDVEVTYAEGSGGTLFFLLDLSRLEFKGMDINIIMVTHPAEDDLDAAAQARALQEYRSDSDVQGFCFHLILGDGENPPNRHMPNRLECVTLQRNQLEQVLSARAPESAFFQLIREQFPIERLNPYNTTIEARGTMFYGRDDELGHLMAPERTGFLVSGARRVGKSSLVLKAYREIRSDSLYRDRTFYFDCRNWKTVHDSVHWLAHKIDPRREARVTKGTRNVTYMLSNRSGGGRSPLFLFMDEIDGVIDWDSANGWRFMSLLREACTQGWIHRIAFVGFRSTSKLIAKGIGHPDGGTSERSPFYEALEQFRLGPLKKNEARRLLTEPFEHQEISHEDEFATVEKVWDSTYGFPYLLQFYGQELFKKAAKRNPRLILPSDVDAIENSSILRDLLMNQFLNNTRIGQKPQYNERYAAFHLAHQGPSAKLHDSDFLLGLAEFGIKPGMDALQFALENLVMANILVEDDGYRFSLPVLAKVLRTKYPDMSTVLLALPSD